MTHAPTAPAPHPTADAAAWLADRAALDDDTRDALGPAFGAGADPGALPGALLALGRAADALRVVACALPPREGVWWAWVAARHAAQGAEARTGKPLAAAQAAALAAAERWITQPTDAHRRFAWAAAEGAGLDTPAGCVGAAVFFTGGSVTPPHGPFVPPPAGVHVTLAATAVLLSAIATDASRLAEVAGAFVEQGAAVVQRLGGWPAAAAAARALFEAQAAQHAEASMPPTLPGAE